MEREGKGRVGKGREKNKRDGKKRKREMKGREGKRKEKKDREGKREKRVCRRAGKGRTGNGRACVRGMRREETDRKENKLKKK